MIDIHTHLLPGVDDGSRSLESSVSSLHIFAAAGVKTVVCTPHLNASRAAAAPFEHHAALLAELRAACPPGISLLRGWEIMLDQPGADLADRRLTLGDSNALLVEFPRRALPPNIPAELFRIRMSGRVPVIAHPERYHGCTPEMVAEWRRVGAVIQMDGIGILGSKRGSELARALLEHGLVDMFASDTHVDDRSLAPVRDWLRKYGSEEHATLLTKTNAERLLNDQEMLPVAPLRLDSGLIGALRRLILGRPS
jgi:protein-tyrosine phosphatase